MKSMKRLFCLLMMAGFAAALNALPDSGAFSGTWSATVRNGGSFDTYEIYFLDNSRCRVTVFSDDASQETDGSYSYDGAFFKLNAFFRNAQIPALTNIQWVSVLSFNANNTAFNILVAVGFGAVKNGVSANRIGFIYQK